MDVLFKSMGPMLKPSALYKNEHKTFVFFKKRLDELFPDVNIPSLFRQLAREDFEAWDLRVFNLSISWLYAGHLDPLSPSDDEAKEQVNDYLDLLHEVSWLGFPTVHNHIVDVVKARKTCHEGWFDPSLVRSVYERTMSGDGLRRFLVDSFVYKSYGQVKYKATAKAYWFTQRGIVLSENINGNNIEFVIDQADAAAVERIVDPHTRSPCHYHNHKPGLKCYLAVNRGLKRKRQDSEDE